ncbi:fha domain containing protein [Sarocladium implicatum]|nr:fha domain containing protein [Sarocladium implicatum]
MTGFHPRSPSTPLFRLRSNSHSAPGGADARPTNADIHFPQVYEDAWGRTTDPVGGLTSDRSDIERARIFLLRFTNMNPDQMINAEIRGITMNPQLGTVPQIAEAIQARIFGGKHATFEATPLLQAVRFMLIKARIPEAIFSERTRSVVDFYFDPTMSRNLKSPPTNPVSFPYPAGRLKVVIIGGGPTALASAISLAEKGREKVEVHLWERRWVWKEGPNGWFADYPPTAKRRDQVVTLQNSVTELMTPKTLQALFGGRPEPVWPGSANIQIRKVEDRLLKRCQEPEFHGTIHLHCEGVWREDVSKVGDFHVLLGADGAASWVRKSYFHGYENERGRSYALGLAFNRPTGLPWSQPLNVFLTLGQTRYLLNASDYDGRGYLNMQLTEEEWHKMVDISGRPVTFGNPGCLRVNGAPPEGFEESQIFAPSEDRESPLWQTIEDGLKLFGFKESEVINVVRIPIVVQAVQEGVQYFPPNESPQICRPHALAAVSGDAAMTVHFWPGRGLNSGIKSGMALGDEIVHALNNGKFEGLDITAMKEYNDFIMKLQDREHDKRSIPILNQSGTPETLGWLLEKAHSIPDAVAVDWLVGAMTQIADRLQRRPDWPFEVVENVEPQIRIVLRQLRSLTLREMAVSFPWPTREMGGAEVLPIRSMKPEEKEKWLRSLWRMLREDKETAPAKTQSRFDGEARTGAPQARFEAARGANARPISEISKKNEASHGLLSPTNGSGNSNGMLRRSSATRSTRERGGSVDERMGRMTLGVPDEGRTGRSPSPGGDIGLTRLLSVKKPNQQVLSDALSLALFRVDE